MNGCAEGERRKIKSQDMEQKDWILKEKELYPPLKEWLNNRGYKAYTEVINMDVVDKRGDEYIGFELKMSCSKTVIHQAYRTKTICGKAYVVTPVMPRKEGFAQCQKYGVGIIRINGSIEILLEAQEWEHRLIEHYLKPEHWEQMTEGDVSGIPNLKGEGPAQCLVKEILKYLETNPKAGWKEIYKNVPNHYSNYKSLANSMRIWQRFTLR